MPTRVTIDGFDELYKLLDTLPKSIRKQVIINSGKKALKPTQRASKQILRQSANSFSNENGFSKLRFIARHIKIVASKNRIDPGVNMYVKAPDLPVGNRFWTSSGYTALLAFGSKDKRETRETKANRGKFSGFGNFIVEGWKDTKTQVRSTFVNGVSKEVRNAFNRAIRRYGKRY